MVENVNAADVIEFLLQKEIIGNEDIPKVMATGNPRLQCRSLLGLLEASNHPQAYIRLYMVIKEKADLQQLVDRFEESYISAGFKMFSLYWLTAFRRHIIRNIFRKVNIYNILGFCHIVLLSRNC